MKKLKILLGLLVMASLMITSCSKDDDEETPQDVKPVISFQTGGNYTSSDVTIAQNETITVGIVCNANSNSGSKLSNFKLYLIINNQTQPAIVDTALNATSFSESWIISFQDVFTGKLYGEITDKAGEKNSVSFNITVEAAAGGILTYSQKLLGSYQSATGSSFASIDGTIYTLADAKANAAKIDFLYFFGATNQATIAAPDDPDAATVFTGTNGLTTWSVLNDTRFKATTLTSANFDDIQDDTQIVVAAQGANLSKANTLQVNDVIAFITTTGKSGLIRVDNIVAGADGTITISVKVQE
ncbi:MAG: hypothetical protein JW861_13955 [Bacteroidales bacterium]|nr:hypothetical protein [Bacteroidales bacterium]